jgi:hypothetical protein
MGMPKYDNGTYLKSLVQSPAVIYCIGFALLFAVFVGTSTFNFGSLARYKIPCLPFFMAALSIIYYNIKTGSVKLPVHDK